MVKVSIIVPIYNVEKYLDRCMQSLLNQSLNDIEIIMVDDGSPDGCSQMCDEYVKKDPRIKVVHKKNEGLGYARNSGLEVAVGEYVAFVDSDDYVREDMYSLLWQVADKTNAEIIECELEKVWTKKKERIILPESYTDIKDYMLRSRVCAWNKLYKTSWIRDLQVLFPKGLLYEDVCFFYKIKHC